MYKLLEAWTVLDKDIINYNNLIDFSFVFMVCVGYNLP
jgi:hypothetical protein